MKARESLIFGASMILAASASPIGSSASAQAVAVPGKPRSTNEQVVTETQVPPPVNSDARRAAEGTLTTGTGASGEFSRTRPGGDSGDINGRAADPATRLGNVGRPGAASMAGAIPAGLDSAMLIEHAIGMAIEGSALKSIAELSRPAGATDDASGGLLASANKQLAASKALLARGAAGGRNSAATAPMGRLIQAANLYITTLSDLSATSPAEKSQVAMINHAVKEALDADHIRRMGSMTMGSPATEELMSHARDMKNEGTQIVARLAGNATSDPRQSPSVAVLARRGRDLIDSAEQVNLAMVNPAGMPMPAATGAPIGTNARSPRGDRPAIIGGTDGTGSAETGTFPGRPPATVRPNAEGSPVPSTPGTSSGTTGGLPPR